MGVTLQYLQGKGNLTSQHLVLLRQALSRRGQFQQVLFLLILQIEQIGNEIGKFLWIGRKMLFDLWQAARLQQDF